MTYNKPTRGRWNLGITMTLLLGAGAAAFAQAAQHSTAPIPSIAHTDGRYALMVDGTPYLELGAQIHNSSAWPATMPAVWAAINAINANTMEAPVYWEAMEPEQGHFDFSQVDMLVDQSRQHGVRLVLLWFGTWKNGSGHYIPQWMKQDGARYPHLIVEGGHSVDSLSPHAPATLEADKYAFSRLMQHLKAKDPQRTVIMVQVENETGVYGAVRDHSAAAEALFHKNVPAAVLKSMGKEQQGSWSQVFGQEADGFFQSWAVATYVNAVAAAGKAEYDIPMYTKLPCEILSTLASRETGKVVVPRMMFFRSGRRLPRQLTSLLRTSISPTMHAIPKYLIYMRRTTMPCWCRKQGASPTLPTIVSQRLVTVRLGGRPLG